MAASDIAISDLAIVELTTDDIEAGLRLSDEAGWNQTAEDWRLFITRGRTIGVRSPRGELVASAAALPYSSDFGYVAMVLVTAGWRRRGVATRLVDQCVERICDWGLVPMLDATEAGALVYRQQGFVPLFELERWQAAGGGSDDNGAPSREASMDDLDRLVAFDARALGAERRFLIEDFLARPATRAFVAESGEGFAMIRRGRRAWQIGPIVAGSPREAIRLLAEALAAAKGAVFIDVPSLWREVSEWLAARGFSRQRGFIRMAHGRETPFGAPELLFASAGPEFG